jgi:phosphate/sulfate permease
MKKPINEIAKLKRLAGLITESEYQEEIAKVEEAKTPVSKDKKIQVIKEWIWYTCDEGQIKDDINKYNKMVDMYFADKDDVTKEDFKKIWAKVTEEYGVGDVGADWDAFPETWNDVQKIYKIDTAYYALNETKLMADTINGKAFWIADAKMFEHKGKAKSKHDLAIKDFDLLKSINKNGKLCFGAPQESFVKVETFKPKSEIAQIPVWIQYACFLAIGLGTLSGGWKIIKTMGTKITKVTPLEGVAAETAGAITLYATQALGIPVSTTHTITGSIIGVGATKRLSAVRWGITRSLMFAWVVTIPVSAIIAGISYLIITLF